MAFFAKQTADHLDHGQFVVNQQDFGHRCEASSRIPGGQATSALQLAKLVASTAVIGARAGRR
jgi:hypothetical protein